MKKVITALLGFLLLLPLALTTSNAHYEYFERIEAIAFNNTTLYIAENHLYALDAENQYTQTARSSVLLTSPTKLTYYGGMLFLIDAGEIKLFHATTLNLLGTMLSGVTDIAFYAEENLLFTAINNQITTYKLSFSPDASNEGYTYIASAGLNYKQQSTDYAEIAQLSALAIYPQTNGYSLYYFGTTSADNHTAYFYSSNSPNVHIQVNLSYRGSSQVTDVLVQGDSLYISSPDGVYAVSLAGYTRHQIVRDYPINLNTATSEGALGTCGAIGIGGNTLFVADTKYKSVQSFNANTLEFLGNIFSQKTSDIGSFNSPSSAVVSGGNLYVADSGNNRVQIVGKSSVSFIPYTFHAPSKALPALDGSVYVLDSSGSRITQFNSSHLLKFTSTSFNYISDIAMSVDGILYCADSLDNKIYYRLPEGEMQSIDLAFSPYKIFHSANKKLLYIMDFSGSIYVYNGEDTQPFNQEFVGKNVNDFALDHSGNIFATTKDRQILRWKLNTLTNITPSLSGRNDEYGNLTSIAITFEASTAYGYGDIVLSDAGKSRIRTISAQDSGVQNIDEADFTHPMPEDNIVARISLELSETPIYSSPFNPSKLSKGNAGDFIIITNQNLADSDYFCGILYQNVSEGKVQRAYILKSAVATAPLSEPPYTQGRVLNDPTPVYQYPMQYSPCVQSGGSDLMLNKNTMVMLLSFASGYKDNTSMQFYKIRIGGVEGYVNAVNVVSRYLMPSSPLPVLNGVIKTENLLGAVLFDYVDGEYQAVSDYPPLPNGTKVHIVGTFNSNSEYTEIYIIDGNNTLRFFVSTQEVESTSLSVLQILALVFIGLLLLIFFMVIIVRRRAFLNRNNP